MEPFSREGRSPATSRIRTHSNERHADMKQNALPLGPPGAPMLSRSVSCRFSQSIKFIRSIFYYYYIYLYSVKIYPH